VLVPNPLQQAVVMVENEVILITHPQRVVRAAAPQVLDFQEPLVLQDKEVMVEMLPVIIRLQREQVEVKLKQVQTGLVLLLVQKVEMVNAQIF
jgi:hypothetical protein